MLRAQLLPAPLRAPARPALRVAFGGQVSHPLAPMLAACLARFAALQQQYRCTLLIYGSVATGEAGPDSDIDILSSGAPLGAASAALKSELEALFGRKVDLVEQRRLIPVLKKRILAQALPIERLIAGQCAPRWAKSPYFYLHIIQREAQDIRREPHRGGAGQARVNARARRIAYFYHQRLRRHCPGIALAALGLGSLRQLVRISTTSDRQLRYTALSASRIRRWSRRLLKRLRLTEAEVAAQIALCRVQPPL